MAVPTEHEADNANSASNTSQINGLPDCQGNRMSKSFVLKNVGELTFEERDESRPCAAREILVRIIATGICGSDVHWWQHGQIGDTFVTAPMILGHESSGIIEECGPQVQHFKPGDRVALEPGAGCNTCIDCRAGKYNLCDKMRFAATPPHDGTLATFYRLPEECCFLLPPQVSFDEGALVEPLAVAVHCCKLGQVGPGSTVAIFGAGPIGLLSGAVAKAFGASRIVIVDIIQSRLDFAQAMLGAGTYNLGRGFDRSALLATAGVSVGSGADVVIEATGNETCVGHGVDVLKRGGVFVQAGLGPSKISFPIGWICSKEATFKGSFRYGPGDYQLAVELLGSGKVSVKELISTRYEFEDAEQAFIDAANRKGIKSIIYGPGVGNFDRGI